MLGNALDRSFLSLSVCLSACLSISVCLSVCEGEPSIHPFCECLKGLWLVRGRGGEGRGSVCLVVEGTTPLGRFMRLRVVSLAVVGGGEVTGERDREGGREGGMLPHHRPAIRQAVECASVWTLDRPACLPAQLVTDTYVCVALVWLVCVCGSTDWLGAVSAVLCCAALPCAVCGDKEGGWAVLLGGCWLAGLAAFGRPLCKPAGTSLA